jgi:hypothetical protein
VSGRLSPEARAGAAEGRQSSLEVPVAELYMALDQPRRSRRPSGGSRRRWRVRLVTGRRIAALVVAAAAFGAGFSTNAVISHVGHNPHPTGVVIGQQVTHQTLANRPPNRASSPAGRFASLVWQAPLLVDPYGSPQSVSCAASNFCALVDDHGRAAVYTNGDWPAPAPVDAAVAIDSVSCPTVGFCMAVDASGSALAFSGGAWSKPVKIDKAPFAELTSVSCSSPGFCVAVDSLGDGFVYTGRSWSPPASADSGAWSAASRDDASLSCPVDGFCVGVDPAQNFFYYVGGNWQPTAGFDPSTPAPSITARYGDAVSCSSPSLCVAAANLGEALAYNGTSWSQPVVVDPDGYLESLSCPADNFCVAVDGLLPDGFGAVAQTGNVFLYNGTTWSTPQNVDGSGILRSVSCPDATFCVAVDQSGNVVAGIASPLPLHH